MFGISTSEFLLIFIILMLVFSPKEIVRILSNVFSYYHKIKEEIELKKAEIMMLEDEKDFKPIINEKEFLTEEDAKQDK